MPSCSIAARSYPMLVPSEKLLEKLDTHCLPTLDRVLMETIAACNQESVTYDRVAQIIKQDPALTVKVLTVANSPTFSPLQPMTSIELALVTLGIETIKAIAITASIRQVMGRVNIGRVINLKRFWLQSLRCGVMAKSLARHCGYGGLDEAYLTGLLHNGGSVAKNPKFSQTLYFKEILINVRFQMAPFSWGADIGLCSVVL